MPGVIVIALDREFQVFPCIRDRSQKCMVQMMTSDGFAACGVQGRSTAAAIRATSSVRAMPPIVHHVGLHHVDRAQVDPALSGGQVPVLLAPGDVDGQRLARHDAVG